jgi:hypothetical protein
MTETSDTTTYATLENGTTGWLARVLEPGQPPEYFVPSLVKYGAFLTKTTLCRALKEAYGEVVFAEEATFNKLVAEREAPDLLIEQDLTLP